MFDKDLLFVFHLCCSVHVTVANELYTLALFDTAGQEDYDRLRPLSYPQTDVFIVCYSVINPASVQNVADKWVPELQHYMPYAPIVLAATQSDLREDPTEIRRLARYKQRPVSTEEGQKMAKKVKAAAYVECSALTQHGLKNVFDEAILTALDPPSKKDKKKKQQCLLF